MRELLIEVFAAIKGNKMRIALTGFSIGWGIFIFIVLISSGQGLLNGMKNNFKTFNVGVVTVTPRQTSQPFEGRSRGRSIHFYEEDITALKHLFGDTVTNEYIITNTGADKMPFVIGGHPAFNCPLCEGEKFEDYKVVFDKALTHRPLRPDHETGLVDVSVRYDVLDGDTIPMKHELFEELDSMIFDGIESKCATLIGKCGKGVKIEYQDMANLLIWSAVGKPDFVALEPWTGISNCSDESDVIENKRGMTILEPDETACFKFKITLI